MKKTIFNENIEIEKSDFENISFEVATKALEAIVTSMESGQLSLEASIQAYERGAALLAHCQKTLLNAEQKIQLLNTSNQLEDYITRDE